MSDFNDLYCEYGKERVLHDLGLVEPLMDCASVGGDLVAVDGLTATNETSDNTPASTIKDWTLEFMVDGKGYTQTKSTFNLLLVLSNDENLNGLFIHDLFAKRIVVQRCPPWESMEHFRVRPVADYDYIRLCSYMESKWGMIFTKEKVADAILSVSMMPENTINPATDYFDSLEWDGVNRLDTWLKEYVSDGKQPDEYLSFVGRKFLCGLAGRAMRPGIKFDNMVIFEGKQYAGKSFLSKIIATVGGEEFFLDDFKDIDNKDALMKMQGKLVVEFPEISGMRRADVNDLKAFISRQDDEFRPPYGRNVITAPRQCVFIGTVNPEGPYLRDITGNRRYWPISCKSKLPIGKLKEVMPLLHAEAAHKFKDGEQLWLNDNEYRIATIQQNLRVVQDVWIDKVEEIVRGKDEVSTDAILSEIGIDVDKRNQLTLSRIMQIMTALGWVSGRVGSAHNRKRGFLNPDTPTLNLDGKEEEIKWS